MIFKKTKKRRRLSRSAYIQEQEAIRHTVLRYYIHVEE